MDGEPEARKVNHVPMSHGWKSWGPDGSLDHHSYTVQALLAKSSEFVEKVKVVEG